MTEQELAEMERTHAECSAVNCDAAPLLREVRRLRVFLTELVNAVPYDDAMFQAYQKHVAKLLDAHGIGHVYRTGITRADAIRRAGGTSGQTPPPRPF